jgi:hypothetical protein
MQNSPAQHHFSHRIFHASVQDVKHPDYLRSFVRGANIVVHRRRKIQKSKKVETPRAMEMTS